MHNDKFLRGCPVTRVGTRDIVCIGSLAPAVFQSNYNPEERMKQEATFDEDALHTEQSDYGASGIFKEKEE